MLSPKLSILTFLLILSACGPARELPENHNDPYNPTNPNPIRLQDVEIFDYTDKVKFSELPLSGDSRDGKKYWSGDYWPLYQGNINNRWNALTWLGKYREAPAKEVALQLQYQELAELSPSEKWDLYLGRYDYPLTTEVNTKSNPEARDWEGICDGWAAASIHHPEPQPKELRNPDGIVIPFGSSDIKALLSYYYAFYHKVPTTHQIGKRCDNNRRIFRSAPSECKEDLNAGSFHLALANTIGLKKLSFLMDVKRYKEVWNQPVVAFTSKIEKVDETPGRNTTEGTVKVLRMETLVTYVNESERNTWYPINGTTEHLLETVEYEYLLYLNASDEIIGGDWKSGKRPDFIWRKPPVYQRNFQGILQYLGALL